MDFGFGAPAVSANVSAVKNNNTLISTYEVPADTPAATPDVVDDWGDASAAPAANIVANGNFGFGRDDFGAAPVAGRGSGFGDGPRDGFGGGASAGFGDDDPFGDTAAGGDAMDLTGRQLTAEDACNARAGGPIGQPGKGPTSKARYKSTADESDSGSQAKESRQARFDSRQDQGQGLP